MKIGERVPARKIEGVGAEHRDCVTNEKRSEWEFRPGIAKGLLRTGLSACLAGDDLLR